MNGGRAPKGTHGYIDAARRRAAVQTLVYLVLALGLFFVGRIVTGSTRNAGSILAVVMCLPMGLSAVSLIMFLKAHPISEKAFEEIERHRGGLLMRYELTMTSEKTTYPVAAATVLEYDVCLFTEQERPRPREIVDHVRLQLGISRYHNFNILATNDLAEFTGWLDALEQKRADEGIDPQAIEDAWEPGTTQTPLGILMSISL